MTVQEATVEILKRYKGILLDDATMDLIHVSGTSTSHLIWMCKTAIDHADSWPVDKLSRWLGFIQGVMTMRGMISVQEERDLTRPLFHAAYEEEGREPPDSFSPIK